MIEYSRSIYSIRAVSIISLNFEENGKYKIIVTLILSYNCLRIEEMSCFMGQKMFSLTQRWIKNGIPILFISGTFMHFLYDFSRGKIVIGMIAAVNESIWEHTKMVLLPVICWWTIYYILVREKNNINKSKWFTGALVALLTAIITIPMLYYFYTEAFGVEILAVDISILFLALLFGQLLGFHFYKYSIGIHYIISFSIFIVLVAIYIIFTFYPPHLPLFRDSMTGQYGIN